jgi:hypothetical protein
VTEIGGEGRDGWERRKVAQDADRGAVQRTLPLDTGSHDLDGLSDDGAQIDRFEGPTVLRSGEILQPSDDERGIVDDARERGDVLTLLRLARSILFDDG